MTSPWAPESRSAWKARSHANRDRVGLVETRHDNRNLDILIAKMRCLVQSALDVLARRGLGFHGSHVCTQETELADRLLGDLLRTEYARKQAFCHCR